MNTNQITTALTLLEALGAEVVDRCADPACEVCAPAFDIAA